MIITVLVCRPDGTQTMEEREVPEDYLPLPETDTEEEMNNAVN